MQKTSRIPSARHLEVFIKKPPRSSLFLCPMYLSEHRCNSSSAEAGVLLAFTGHGPTSPESGTHYHGRGQAQTIIVPTMEARPRFLIRRGVPQWDEF
ncbi:hypothetical protein AVEN_6361-1 [Araneus ventricosus]|uniref:Uncharacterized protein n=1 Tax=Araneus ventricosus TaxID=182803 RepID=A0A4Y2HUT0_ARAVE|nr:hypothetical protein AVEN_6361-1 [Araneus ventricosus]